MSKVEVSKDGKRFMKVHPALADVLTSRGYFRRDMVAQEPTKAPAVESGLDSEGQAWSADLHTANKAKTQAGTWRKKPGAKQ